ncbi:MAG: Ig-like domain-containing protein [Candidatus Sulfotelmatobacter sp.]
MNGKLLSGIVLIGAAILLWSLASCGRSSELVGIQIQPTVETFGASNIPVAANAGATVQLRALGSYIHPPVTKDITNQVTWASNDTQMFTVDSSGLLTATGMACGGSLISATVKTNTSSGGLSSNGAIVTGYMTGNVVCFTSSGGGGAGSPVLTVTFGGSGSGSVTDSAQAINCAAPTPCAFLVASGTALTLTATPAGTSVFGSWAGCDSANNINPCTLTLTGNRTVTATFN